MVAANDLRPPSVAPVLTMAEAPKHPHMAARQVFVERHGIPQPPPAPRISRTPSAIREPEKVEIGELVGAWQASADRTR